MTTAVKAAYESAVAAGPVDASGDEISRSILLGMKAYYDDRYEVCQFLNKEHIGAGADQLVETVLLHLKTYLDSHRLPLTVRGEAWLPGLRMRPDISVWLGDRPVATIECKTTLGWNRGAWEEDFLSRRSRICDLYPNVKCFLVVFSGRDAPGVAASASAGSKYFVLSRVWPHKVNVTDPSSDILARIEPLFLEIATLADAGGLGN